MLKLIIVTTVLLALAFAGIAIKMFFFKGAEFRKSCSSIDPSTGKRMGCSCGGAENSTCENR
ncbi:MAG TPA: hypothetical protein PKN21_14330 [Bacteroidales bacterium]|nr:hypothetical protein [Bacteroidales bacterium]